MGEYEVFKPKDLFTHGKLSAGIISDEMEIGAALSKSAAKGHEIFVGYT